MERIRYYCRSVIMMDIKAQVAKGDRFPWSLVNISSAAFLRFPESQNIRAEAQHETLRLVIAIRLSTILTVPHEQRLCSIISIVNLMGEKKWVKCIVVLSCNAGCNAMPLYYTPSTKP